MTYKNKGSSSLMSRRDVMALMAGTAAAALLVRPGFAQQPSDITGVLSLGITSSQEKPFRAVVEAYQAVRPNVQVEFNVLPGGQNQLRQNLITRQMANHLPDLINTYDRFPRQFSDAGLTADLTPYLHSGGPVNEEFFAAPFLGSYRVVGGAHEGEIHALPLGADTVVLYYNKAHFDEAGIPYPDNTWTWDKLVEVARALTKKEGDRTSRFGFGVSYSWASAYVPMIQAFGGSFFSDGLVHLDTEAAQKTYHLYLDNVKEGIFIDPATAKAAGDENIAFASGQVSMISSVRNSLPRIRAAMPDGFDFDVAMQPTINGTRTIGMGSVGIAITPQALNNTDVVYDFLNFFYSGDGGMKVLVSTYAVVPPVVALYNDPSWRDLPAPPHDNQVFVDSIDPGIPNPAGIPADSQSTIDATMGDMVQAVLIGGQSVEDALKAAEAKINETIKRSTPA